MAAYFRMRRDLTAPIPDAPLPAGVTLQPFDAAIAPACRILMDRAYAPAGDAPVPFEKWYATLLGDSEYHPVLVWVAVAEGDVVGFCQCWSVSFIKDMVVDERWRRRGLAGALLTLAMREFVARGAPSIELKTDVDNVVAQSVYRRMGFAVVERVE